MRSSGTLDRTDRLSTQLAAELRGLLEGLPVGALFEVPPSAEICYCLELFLPRSLRDQHPEWEKESLDGIFVARAKKTGTTTAEVVGTAILISDQTVTPFAVELGVPEPGGPVVVRKLNLGETGSGPLGISGPAANSKDAQHLSESLLDRIDEVQWSYSLHAMES
jgi:hypothetical protein